MTHDDLLERVNRIKVVSCDENIDFEHVHSLNEPKACNECLTCMGLSALRAVVELHKPVLWQKIEMVCDGCGMDIEQNYNSQYPCETIEAIEAELK